MCAELKLLLFNSMYGFLFFFLCWLLLTLLLSLLRNLSYFSSCWHLSHSHSWLPWVPEVFLACGGNFRCWPKADTSYCLILMNILSYKLNYLVFAAVRAELKLLLCNSVSGFLFIFLCWLLFTTAFSILWNLYYFPVADIYFILGEKTWPFSGLDFCQFFPQNDLL